MRIVVIGDHCPVLPGVSVGVQRGKEVEQEFPADGSVLTWVLDARRVGADIRGRYVHGRPGNRFLYLSWQRHREGMFRRAKLMLNAVTEADLEEADQHGLTARLSLLMPDGTPVCAAVSPPRIRWSTPRE